MRALPLWTRVQTHGRFRPCEDGWPHLKWRGSRWSLGKRGDSNTEVWGWSAPVFLWVPDRCSARHNLWQLSTQVATYWNPTWVRVKETQQGITTIVLQYLCIAVEAKENGADLAIHVQQVARISVCFWCSYKHTEKYYVIHATRSIMWQVSLVASCKTWEWWWKVGSEGEHVRPGFKLYPDQTLPEWTPPS